MTEGIQTATRSRSEFLELHATAVMRYAFDRSGGYTRPGIESVDLGDGRRGLRATAKIDRGSVVVVFGGIVVTTDQLLSLPPRARAEGAAEIDDGLYILSLGDGPSNHLNHSCQPNSGLRGPITVVAMRHIHPGEAITMDYAMVDTTPYCEFDCECGAQACRKRITGRDWMLEELWDRYEGYFAPHVWHKILKRSQQETGLWLVGVGR